MNLHVNKCLELESTVSSTGRMRRILDVKYEKVPPKQGHDITMSTLNPQKTRKSSKYLKIEYFSMELLASGIPPRCIWN